MQLEAPLDLSCYSVLANTSGARHSSGPASGGGTPAPGGVAGSQQPQPSRVPASIMHLPASLCHLTLTGAPPTTHFDSSKLVGLTSVAALCLEGFATLDLSGLPAQVAILSISSGSSMASWQLLAAPLAPPLLPVQPGEVEPSTAAPTGAADLPVACLGLDLHP